MITFYFLPHAKNESPKIIHVLLCAFEAAALILAQEKKVSTLHFTYPKQENPL